MTAAQVVETGKGRLERSPAWGRDAIGVHGNQMFGGRRGQEAAVALLPVARTLAA
jgi:hypothetical protein